MPSHSKKNYRTVNSMHIVQYQKAWLWNTYLILPEGGAEWQRDRETDTETENELKQSTKKKEKEKYLDVLSR